MKSTAAKVIFIALIIIAGLAIFFINKYGPDRSAVTRENYKSFIKTEATIISQEGTGRVRSSRIIWTIQFQDQANKIQTVTMDEVAGKHKDNGEKIVIYYDPSNTNILTDEKSYKEIMD